MTPAAGARARPSRGRLAPWIIGLASLAVLGLAGWVWLKGPHKSEADRPARAPGAGPEPLAATPFLNAAPGVAYVGDDACAGCHEGLARTYHRHPMGRSLQPVAAVAAGQDYSPKAGNPFEALGFLFQVERQGNGVLHRELARDPWGRTVARTEAAVAYAIGSGTHAFSYLIEHDGVLTQSPVTWFSQKQAWDLSPGFKDTRDRFERPVVAGCLFCHCNHAEPDPDTVNTYRQPVFQGLAIGCERCHGPGALHVEAAKQGAGTGAADLTIVNPARLEAPLREAVCAQCHLGGRERVLRRGRGAFDFRPGLPLDQFWRVFVLPPEAARGNRVAGHVEQMHASRCYQQSAGRLGCTSCHDPHELPATPDKEGYYRDRCLQCHETRPCSLPRDQRRRQSPGDACAACHMPRGETNVSHVALTDHRVTRRPAPAEPARAEPSSLAAVSRLVPFGQDRLDPRDAELMRDLAVGVIFRARTQPESFRAEASRTFLPLLERARKADPDDLAVCESLSVARAWLGEWNLALATCEATLERAPRRELVLSDAGVTCQKMGRADRGLPYWQRALAINPWSSRYRAEVAGALAQQGQWPEAVTQARRALAENGAQVSSRLLLMQFYYENKQMPQARAEWEAILALHPPNEAELRKQFVPLLK